MFGIFEKVMWKLFLFLMYGANVCPKCECSGLKKLDRIDYCPVCWYQKCVR